MTGRRWRQHEIDVLQECRARGEHEYRRIAQELGRSICAVQNKILALRLGEGAHERWTQKDYEVARDMLAAGHDHEAIAARIGRSVSGVKQKLALVPQASGRPTELMLLRRDRREDASYRRDLTGMLCGDPPPGYSALDRKRAAHA